jgi:hypothetical protein
MMKDIQYILKVNMLFVLLIKLPNFVCVPIKKVTGFVPYKTFSHVVLILINFQNFKNCFIILKFINFLNCLEYNRKFIYKTLYFLKMKRIKYKL